MGILNATQTINSQNANIKANEVNRNLSTHEQKLNYINQLTTSITNGLQTLAESKVNATVQDDSFELKAIGKSILEDDSIDLDKKIEVYDKKVDEYWNAKEKNGSFIERSYRNRYKDELELTGKQNIAEGLITKINNQNKTIINTAIQKQINALANGEDIIDLKNLVIYKFDATLGNYVGTASVGDLTNGIEIPTDFELSNKYENWLTEATKQSIDGIVTDDVLKSTKPKDTSDVGSYEELQQKAQKQEKFNTVVGNIYKLLRSANSEAEAKSKIEENIRDIELGVMISQANVSVNNCINRTDINNKDEAYSELRIKDLSTAIFEFSGKEMTDSEMESYNEQLDKIIDKEWANAQIDAIDKLNNSNLSATLLEIENKGEAVNLVTFNEIYGKLGIQEKFLTGEGKALISGIKGRCLNNSLSQAANDYRDNRTFDDSTNLKTICDNLKIEEKTLIGYLVETDLLSKEYESTLTNINGLPELFDIAQKSTKTPEQLEYLPDGNIIVEGYGTETQGAYGYITKLLSNIVSGNKELEKGYNSIINGFTHEDAKLSNISKIRILCDWAGNRGLDFKFKDENGNEIILDTAESFYQYAVNEGMKDLKSYYDSEYEQYNSELGLTGSNKKTLEKDLDSLGKKNITPDTGSFKYETSLEGYTFNDWINKYLNQKSDGTHFSLLDIYNMAMASPYTSENDCTTLKELSNSADAYSELIKNVYSTSTLNKLKEGISGIYGKIPDGEQYSNIIMSFLKYSKNNENQSIENNTKNFIDDLRSYNTYTTEKIVNGKFVSKYENTVDIVKDFKSSNAYPTDIAESYINQGTNYVASSILNRGVKDEEGIFSVSKFNELKDSAKILYCISAVAQEQGYQNFVIDYETIKSGNKKEIEAYFNKLLDKDSDSVTVNYLIDIAKKVYTGLDSFSKLDEVSEDLLPLKSTSEGTLEYNNGSYAKPYTFKNGNTKLTLYDKNDNLITNDIVSNFSTKWGSDFSKTLLKVSEELMPIQEKISSSGVNEVMNKLGTTGKLSEQDKQKGSDTYNAFVSAGKEYLKALTDSENIKEHGKISSAIGKNDYYQIKVCYASDDNEYKLNGNMSGAIVEVVPNTTTENNVVCFYKNGKCVSQYEEYKGNPIVSYPTKSKLGEYLNEKTEENLKKTAEAGLLLY